MDMQVTLKKKERKEGRSAKETLMLCGGQRQLRARLLYGQREWPIGSDFLRLTLSDS